MIYASIELDNHYIIVICFELLERKDRRENDIFFLLLYLCYVERMSFDYLTPCRMIRSSGGNSIGFLFLLTKRTFSYCFYVPI